jgi:predicted amidohydrolase
LSVKRLWCARDTESQNVDLKKDCLDFAEKQGWEQSNDSIFRVNTPEEYETLNLKSNGKNKHNIILSIGDDKVTQESVQSLYEKHPDNSVIVTLDEQGRLVFPEDKVFIPDGIIFAKIFVFTTYQSSTIQIGVQSLYEKHPDNSVIVTLDEQGRLVFPEGKVFIPDDDYFRNAPCSLNLLSTFYYYNNQPLR